MSETYPNLDSTEQSPLVYAQPVKYKATTSTESVSTTCDMMSAALTDNYYTKKEQIKLMVSLRDPRSFWSFGLPAPPRTARQRCEETTSIEAQSLSDKDTESLESVSAYREEMISKNVDKESELVVANIKADRSMKDPNMPMCPYIESGLFKPINFRGSPSLSYISEINSHHSTDTSVNGWIIGGVMVYNNMLSMVDCPTYSVKIIDVNSNTFIASMNLPSRPWNIARLEREQIVVLCDSKLVFIKVGRTLSVEKEVDIRGDCCGIAYANNTLIVSFLNPGSVKILDSNGHILKVISKDDKGRQLFEEPCYIALSPDQETLYVSDEAKHIVISMDLNGTVQYVYKRDTLISPRSIAVDRDGCIYIAGKGSYNMHIISSHCRTIRIFDEETWGINSPYEIIYCKRDNKLYISHFHGFGNPVNKVSAYQIER